jgi:hypothetical protein
MYKYVEVFCMNKSNETQKHSHESKLWLRRNSKNDHEQSVNIFQNSKIKKYFNCRNTANVFLI